MAHADHFDFRAEVVAGADGLGPAHLFSAGADHAAGDLDGQHAEAHHDGGGEPSGGGEAIEEGAFAGSFVEVEGLRVILLAELLDLCGGHRVTADGVEFLADVKVLEVKLLGHGVRLLVNISLRDDREARLSDLRVPAYEVAARTLNCATGRR